jgi:hypothetical protein
LPNGDQCSRTFLPAGHRHCAPVRLSGCGRSLQSGRTSAPMLINLSGTYYHYCEIDNGTVTTLMSAESMGRFYNLAIKGRFDCRMHRIPNY